ncbi:GNAT family N-acetyltransferase [Parasphingorhabdus pacifica]
MTREADLAEQAHLRSAVLLRRWLAETHTPVRTGALRLQVGPLRLRTEVTYHSPTGAHGFGVIHVLDSTDSPMALADPGVIAAAISQDARARAEADAPINSATADSLLDWVLRSLPTGEVDPLGWEADIRAMAEAVTGPEEAERWLVSHVEGSLLPALNTLEASPEKATADLLTRRGLAAIGVLGRRGVVNEADALRVLSRRLHALAETHPHTEPRVRHWLSSSTLTDLAVLNGSNLRYRSVSGEVRPQPVHYEFANPLRDAAEPDVPGVPLPRLGDGWSLRPVRIEDADDGGSDVRLVHHWMNEEHVAANWKQDWSLEQWRKALMHQLDGNHSVPCVISAGGRQIGYLEVYRVVRDTLAGCYPHHPRDLGVHIAIGEQGAIGRGMGSSLLRTVARGLLDADPECRRVVAEPNVHNGASIGAFAKAGFVREREVGLPDKNSALMVFAR